MSSSAEQAGMIVRGEDASRAVSYGAPRVRRDQWTRLAEGNLRDDEVAEGTFTAVASTVKEAARAQGYAIGWSQGRRDVLAEVRAEAEAEAAVVAEQNRINDARREAEHSLALARLSEAAEAFSDGLAHACQDLEDHAAALAFTLVRELLERDAAVAAPHDIVSRALGLMPEDGPMTIRLHPQVCADPAAAALRRPGVRVVADQGLDRTDVIVDLDDSVIDARIRTAIERLGQVWGC